MLYLSKSKYCGLWQCPKIAWLRKYKPDEFVADGDALSRMEEGNVVGDLAMGLFGDFVEVTAYDGERINLSKMIENTKSAMAGGMQVICEASFDYRGLYCAVDILKANGSGYDIYEVKSSTHSDKDVYVADIAFQKYVLEHCGVDVQSTYLITINSDYVFDGELKLNELFDITDVSEAVAVEFQSIASNLSVAQSLLQSEVEPPIDLHPNCNHPYKCGFWNYCSKHLPSPSVFDLYRMPFKKKLEFYYADKYTYESLQEEKGIKNDKQKRQIDHAINDRPTYVDKEKIREFLSTLSYPIYFLDFETLMSIVPTYVGTRPYSQIPFQYSLHYIEYEGGPLKHKEFLAQCDEDPRRPLAQRLCEDIPKNVCVTAYNKGFECGRIKELAAQFPDLAEHLTNIQNNIIDLLTPFQSGYYYNRAMGGSFSIKSVLPAIYPDDESLDYRNLEQVHNGGEAMRIFPKIKNMPPQEQEITRQNLLNYCKLDTFAMVKVWEELVRVSK